MAGKDHGGFSRHSGVETSRLYDWMLPKAAWLARKAHNLEVAWFKISLRKNLDLRNSRPRYFFLFLI